MRIVSWNVNGIRACLDKGFADAVQDFKADYVCLQESKAVQEQVTFPSTLSGLNSTWATAEKKGYSGTVTLTPHKTKLSNKLGILPYDAEGRATIAYADTFTLVNLYFPNGAASPERHQFKMKFLDDILIYLKKLEAERGPLVVCGDYNIAHTEIDIHDPKGNQDSSGFLPEEREWMTKFFASGFVDTFRHLYPKEKEQYSWWSYRMRSRERNKGWRIDYISVSESLRDKISGAAILPHIHGSDHCPIALDLHL